LVVIRQLRFERVAFEVVLSGSLFDGGPLLTEAMRDEIHVVAPWAHLVRLTAPPVIGGVLLGMEQAQLGTERLRPILAESARELLRKIKAQCPRGPFAQCGTLNSQSPLVESSKAQPVPGFELPPQRVPLLPFWGKTNLIGSQLAAAGLL
jgi:hypothetical protein